MENNNIQKIDENLLDNITDYKEIRKGAYNIRKNGKRDF